MLVVCRGTARIIESDEINAGCSLDIVNHLTPAFLVLSNACAAKRNQKKKRDLKDPRDTTLSLVEQCPLLKGQDAQAVTKVLSQPTLLLVQRSSLSWFELRYVGL